MTRPNAVVTGASSGIGAATARHLAEQGYRVVVAARRRDRVVDLAREIDGESRVLDVTNEESVDALSSVQDCAVLINGAGAAFGADSVESGTPADWQRMYDVTVLGTLRVTQALLPALRNGTGGTIVNLTSTAAFVNYEGGGGYSAAKHGQHALSATLRLELSGEPIRVVEIAPGMVHTEEFSLNRFGGNAERADGVYEDVDHPLTAEDVAECIGFAVGLPLHVNIDEMTIRPLAQAAQHKLHRGKIFER